MNTSIKQLNIEVATAKKQALTDPYQFERPDFNYSEDGNSLIEVVQSKKARSHTGKISFPSDIRAKIDNIFDKFPDQLKILGLYYDGGFTAEEIADMPAFATQEDSITRSLRRAKARLKKNLTTEEYDSIRRFIGDHKPTLAATQERHVNPFYNDFVEEKPVITYQWDGQLTPKVELHNHPPEKHLPKGSFYYEVQSIETGITGCAH